MRRKETQKSLSRPRIRRSRHIHVNYLSWENSWTPWNLHTELRYTHDTYNLVVYSSFISAIKAPSKSTQKRAIIKRYKENEVAETASSSTESPIQILR